MKYLVIVLFFICQGLYSQEKVVHHYPKDGVLVIDSTYLTTKHIYHFYPSQTWDVVYHNTDVSILRKLEEGLVIYSFRDSTDTGWFDFVRMNRNHGNFKNYMNTSEEIKEGILQIKVLQDTTCIYIYKLYTEMIKN